MKLKNIILIILGVCSFETLKSQHALGLMIGDYNSPQSAFLNPALSRTNPGYRAYINWWGSSVSVENNFMQYNAPFRLGQWIKGDYPSELVNINGTLAFDQDWLPTYTSVNNWKLNYLNEVYGPAFFVPVDNVGTFGFGVKEVSGFSVNGLNGEFGGILRYGLSALDANKGKNIVQDEFSINTEKYQEWYMSFAGFNNGDQVNSWRWGLNMKFLLGMGMAHLGSDQIDITVNDRNSVQINQMNARYYHTWGASSTLRNPFGMSFDFLEGAGLGADLGVVYEHRSKGNKPSASLNYCEFEKNNAYDWKVGFSLTNLGIIYYTGEADDILSTANTNWNVNQNIVQNGQFVQGDEKFFGITRTLFEPLGADKYNEFASYLPFAFNMQFDKRVNQNWHVGGYWTQNLKRKNSVGLRRASYLSLIPRWQSEQMEFGFPLTIANDYTKVHYGAYGRIGPVIIGSNNLIGLGEFLTNAQYSGGDFYFTVRSKLGGCERRLNSIVFKEVTYDTTYKKETVNIEKIIYDTVVTEKTVKVPKNSPDSLVDNNDLLEKNNKLQAELENNNKKIDALNDSLGLLRNELKNSKAIALDLSRKCDEELNKLNKKIDLKQKEIDQLEDQLKNEKAIISATSSPGNGLVDTCCSELSNKRNQLITLEKEKTQLTTEYQNFISKAELDLLSCNKKIEATQKLLDAVQKQLAEEKRKSSELEAENEVLKGQISRLSAASISNDCEDALLKAQASLLEEKKRNSNLSADKEQLQNELIKLKNENAILLSDKKKCQEELEKRNSEITATKNSFDSEKYAQLLEENNVLKEKLSQRESEFGELNKNYNKLIAEKSNCEKELANSKAQLSASKNSEISVSEDCNDYKNKIKELELKLSSLQSDFSDAQITIEKLNKAQEQLNNTDEVGKLKTELVKSTAQITALQAELDSCVKRAAKIKVTASKTDSTDYYKSINSKLELKSDSLKKELALTVEKLKNIENRLTQSGDDIQKKLAFCEEEKSNLQAKLKLCDEEKVKSSESEKALRAQIIQMDGDMYKLGEIIKTNNAEIANQKERIEKLNAQLKECNENLRKSNVEASTSNIPADTIAKYNTLNKELRESQIKITQLQNEANECKIQSKKLQADKLLCEEQLKNAKSEVTTAEDCTPFKNMAAELDATVKDLEKQAQERNSEIELLRKEKSELESKITAVSVTEDCTPFKEKATQLDAKVNTLQRQVKTYEEEIKLLTEQKAQVEAEVAAAKNNNEDCEPFKQKVSQLELEVGKLNDKLNSEMVKNEELKKQVSTLEASVSNSTNSDSEISNLKSSLNDANSKLEVSTQKITSLQNELENCKKSLNAANDLKAQIETLKNEVNNKNQELEAMTSKLNKINKEKSDLQSQIEACQSEKKTYIENESMLRAQIIQMDADMLELSKSMQERNKTIEALKEKVGVLETELKNCNEKIAPSPEGGDN